MTQEEKELLEEIKHHEGLPVLFSEMDHLCQAIELAVIKYDLASGSNDELVRRKCRAEGARQLFSHLKQHLKNNPVKK